MENDFSKGLFIGIMIGFVLAMLLRCVIVIPVSPEKTQSVSEYINHPENFKIEYVTYNGDTTDIIVNYLK